MSSILFGSVQCCAFGRSDLATSCGCHTLKVCLFVYESTIIAPMHAQPAIILTRTVSFGRFGRSASVAPSRLV